MNETAAPIRVVVTRDRVESEHLVDAVIADEGGARMAWGRIDAAVIPRSSLKPVQTIPLLRTGAAAAFDLSEVELALATASHSGEPPHVAAVEAWLDRLGFGPEHLECGADEPIDDDEVERLLRSGGDFGPLHNCCSGKHAGFLTIARHLDLDPAGYISRSHPVQQLVVEATEQFCGLDLSGESSGLDGCGIPTFSIPAENLARALVGIVRPGHFDDATAEAATTVARTMIENPWWVSGTGRPEVELSEVASEPLLSKGGAEGVFVAALPERGTGLALKCRDGSARGARTALAGVLEHLGVVPAGTARSEVRNKAGTVVGELYAEVP